MSPILVRPVREQLEHDRIIRQLQAKFRRKYEVGINPGTEQAVPVGGTGSGPAPLYPDVVLLSMDRGRKLQCVVEVETGESVNHLEALAEWAHFSRTRAPFHLYVPAGMVDVARRLSEDNHIYVSEIWGYHPVGDQMRFTMVYRNKDAAPALPKKPAAPKPAGPTLAGPKLAEPKPAAPKPAGPKLAAAKPAGPKLAAPKEVREVKKEVSKNPKGASANKSGAASGKRAPSRKAAGKKKK